MFCALPWAVHARYGNVVPHQEKTSAAPAASADALQSIRQKLAADRKQVRQLQQEVDRQQSRSQQANQRLQQQDQSIANLRRQLEKLRPASKLQGADPVSH